jgi:serine/threonine protein kinase
VSSPDKFIGRYKIVDRIGACGMGSLYLAHDPAIDRMVAIKALREGFDTEELRERFARESRAAGRLRHPNIVTIFDVGDHEGQPFIAMEYVPGETLAQLIRRRPILPLSRKVRLVEEICDGLAYAHKSGIIHRDVKPANLMVDAEGMVKILDFGIVRIADSGITQAGVLVGTVNYMSPEQVTGSSVDHRSDLFAVGAVAYELFAYRQAFPGTLKDGVLHRILHTDPPQLAQVCPDIDSAIPPIIARALDKDITRRYQDLKAMQRDLARVRERLEDEEVESPTSLGIEPETAVVDARPLRTPTPKPGAREGIEQRRAALIQQHLDTALRALDASDYEKAIASADEAVLLDPTSARANQVLDRAHLGLEMRKAAGWVKEARQHLDQGDIDGAWSLVDKALGVRLDAPEAQTLNRNVQEIRREVERARERAMHVRKILERGQASLATGAFEIAVRAADEALAIQPGQTAATRLKSDALQGLAARQQQEDQAAAATIREARRQFNAGQHASAISLLEHHQPHHDAVAVALDDMRRQAAEHERQVAEQARRAAEARRREDERLRIESERQAREQKVAALRAAAEHAASQSRFDDALARVTQAREIQPDSEVLARLVQKITDAKEAAEEAERRRASARQKLGPLSELLTARNLEQAERLAAEVISLDPGNADVVRQMDEIRRLRGEFQKLLTQAKEAIGKSRFADARAALERARAIDPHVAEVQDLLQKAVEGHATQERQDRLRQQATEKLDAATRALTLRDFAEALVRVDEALALMPDSAPARRLKGEIESVARAAQQRHATIAQRREQLMARLAAGDLQKGEALIREILQLDADDEQARAARDEIARRRGQLNDLLGKARSALAAEQLEDAQLALERGRGIDTGSREVDRLFKQLNDAIATRERRERRRREMAENLAQAEAALEAGDFDAAGRFTDAAAASSPGAPEVDALRKRLKTAREQRPPPPPVAEESDATQEIRAVSGGLSTGHVSTSTTTVQAPPAVARDYGAFFRRVWNTRAARMGAAAAVLLLLGVTIWRLVPESVPDPADAYLEPVDRLIAANQHAAALKSIEEGLRLNADHASLRARLGSVVQAAAASADAARNQVVSKAGQPDTGAMQEAANVHDEARRLAGTGVPRDMMAGARAYWNAADLYGKVRVVPAKTPAVALVAAEWARGDKARALELLEQELKKAPGDRDLGGYLRAPVHADAVDTVARAEKSARDAGSSSTLSAAFQDAARKEKEGAQPTPQGVRALWQAADLYASAAKSVAADVVKRAELLRRKEPRQALSLLVLPAFRKYASDPLFVQQFQLLDKQARTDAATARDEATKAQATEAASVDFRTARNHENEALRASEKGDLPAAAGKFWDAAEAYTRAKTDAEAETRSIAELGKSSVDAQVRIINEQLGAHPNWNRFAARVTDLRRDAETAMQSAKQKADAARASATPSYKQALGVEALAHGADLPIATAIDRFWAAAALYLAAPGEVSRPNPGGGTRPEKRPDANPDVAAIEALLQEYASRNMSAVRKIWPGSRSRTEAQFSQSRSIDLKITDVAVTFNGSDQAVVRCTMTYKYDWKKAGPPDSSGAVVLSLRKSGSSWWIMNR